MEDALHEFKIQGFVREHKFAYPPRKWEMDFADPVRKICIEVQGGVFINGRHNRGADLKREYEKLNTAAKMGWRVFFATTGENHPSSVNAVAKIISELDK